MISLHTLSDKELESRARLFAEQQLPDGNRLQVLILALCDRMSIPATERGNKALPARNMT